MNKADLIALETHAHLSYAELVAVQPELAAKLEPKLDARLADALTERLTTAPKGLREIAKEERVRAAASTLRVRDLRRNDKLAEVAASALHQHAGERAPELVEEIAKLDRTAGPTLGAVAGIDIPLRGHPAFSDELARGRVYRVAEVARLPDRTADVLAKIGAIHKISEASLGAAVQRGELDRKQARAAGHAVALYRLLDDRPELVGELADAAADPARLVELDDAGWRRAIDHSKTAPPGGIAAAEYATLLRDKVEATFPTRAFAHRLAAAKVKPAPGDRAAAHRYPGLRLGAVLGDADQPVERRTAEATRRIDLAHRMFADNPELLGLDLSPRGEDVARVAFPGTADPSDRKRLLAMARAYQRALAIGGTVTTADALIAAGLHSAIAIARVSAAAMTAATGLNATAVASVLTRAGDLAANASVRIGTLIDITHGGFRDLPNYNVPGEVDDFLKEIPGYAEFFGNQDYCDCNHCKSIFGPAAYFVDLMRFVDAHVGPVFAAAPQHPIALRQRRPDLWDRLELTCENTNTEIPYLEVINEILEDAVARDVGFANMANRVAVRDRVYGNELRFRVNSFQQPFHLPFVELVTYLRPFDRTLADLGEASRATGNALTRLRLALPPVDFTLITVPELVVANLSTIYGIAFVGAPAIQPFDVQFLLPRMAVTREQLGALSATRWVTSNGAQPLAITAERRDPVASVQNDIERISGLRPESLDRMHRFVRLWRATGWHIGELDLVRSHLEAAGVGTGLDPQLVGGVALVHRICTTMNLGVEDAITLFSTIPARAILSSPPPGPHSGAGATVYPRPASPLARLTHPLLDRLFNQARYVELGGRYPQPATRITHPALALVPPANLDPHLHRLQAGLGCDEDQLFQLIVGLARPLGIRPAAPVAADRELALSARNLALLYRHARLARLFRVTIPELFALAALTLCHGYVETLDDVQAVIRGQRWLAANPRWTLAALIELVRPGGPAIAATRAALAATAAGVAVTYSVTEDGAARAPETVTFAANATLATAIADWNGQAQRTIAYRADALGMPNPNGDRFAIRSRAFGSTTRIHITGDAAQLFAAAAALPRAESGADFMLVGPQPAVRPAIELARELVSEVARAGSLVFADTVFTRVPGVTDAQSRALIAANAGRLEAIDAEGRYRLRVNYDPGAALATGALPAAIEPQLRGVLAQCHGTSVLLGALPGKLAIAPDALDRLLQMLGDNLAEPVVFGELRDPAIEPVRIAAVIARLRRLAALVTGDVFDIAALDLVRAERARFGIASFDRIDLAAVRRVELFRALSEPWLDRGQARPDLPGMITRYTEAAGFAAGDVPGLAALLHCDVALVGSLQADLPRTALAFDALEQLIVAIVMSRQLGVGGAVLGLVRSDDYALLGNASAAIQAVLRAKYPDEAEWETAREPLRDAVLSRRRDGLVAYLTRSRQTYPFDEVNDLYHHFLLDVQLEGVTRTSRVAAAIASVQLYIQRVLGNLEETPVGAAAAMHVPPSAIPAAEWEWRQNYRVWEANRKVFLYPENYLEPELRDDKTPLFRALEDELLSKPITEEAVREAYARYLRGFDELAALTLAGSYHERDEAARHDVLHLFGATSDDPPLYYYRRVDDAHFGVGSDDRATRWGAWLRVELQIPSRVVSPIVHNGQLHLFWVRYTTRSLNQIDDGGSKFVGYNHRAHVEFSKRRLDGTWTSPQPVSLTEAPFTVRGDGVVLDPLVARNVNAFNLPLFGEIRLYSKYQPLFDNVAHEQPMDDYSLRGFGWDRVYPASNGELISLRGIDFQMWSNLDLYTRRIGPRFNYDPINPPGSDLEDRGVPWVAPEFIEGELVLLLLAILLAMLFSGDPHPLASAVDSIREILNQRPRNMLWSARGASGRELHAMTLGDRQYVTFDAYTFTSLLLEQERIQRYKLPLAAEGYGLPQWEHPQWHPDVTSYLEALLVPNQIAQVPSAATLESVNGTYSDVIIQHGREVFHIGFRTVDGKPFVLRRLGTSVAEPLARTLFNQGLDALLATSNQLQTNEASHGFALTAAQISDRSYTGGCNFDGPMGTYLRELFFHIPFLLADHLNSLGECAAAERWYHVIFDPTSTEAGADRVWRYREHRGLGVATVRQQLQNANAIEAYKRDPFNPHAIARNRITAYQKAIVMKYIDNLLDWGDELFARAYSASNPEYLREATLKYVLAQELLGRRPARLGDCGERGPRRYPEIVARLLDDGEFLLEVESLVAVVTPFAPTNPAAYYPTWSSNAAAATAASYRGKSKAKTVVEAALGRELRAEDRAKPPHDELRAGLAKLTAADYLAIANANPPVSAPVEATLSVLPVDIGTVTGGFGISLVSQISTVFCIPDNPTLRSYWDRVEDRLYKLRNSLDPEGVFRRLPLFAPPIDPALLVRAHAAGLGIEDVLGQTAGGLPAYRFVHLLEKAKAYAATVQSFGGALLSALEKRDGEALANLRNRHERNLLTLNRDVRRSDVAAAEVSVEQVQRQIAAATYRHEYFSGLVATGLSTGERLQVGFKLAASVLRGADMILKLAAGIGYLVPEVGSPFAMKYGGKQLADSFDALAQSITSAAAVADLVADMSGLVAGFDRREQGWQHDERQAANDLRVLDRERAASEIRLAIARKSLQIHFASQDQHDEVLELYRDKFSGIGLYTYLARMLQQLHRSAFGNALAIAQLAERAYHFELPGDADRYVGGQWDGARSGLLSGEQLMLDLGRMERRFLERNERKLEITQSFSLDRIAPGQLIALRETGAAEFHLRELDFDLAYPGQYRRQLRAVRLSVPCVTGPYTNISARLELVDSEMRGGPLAGPGNVIAVPLGRTNTVATSSAQNDGGVFELGFHDDRYNPFEGAGAVSHWRIALPSTLRPFDYRTISDVILTLSYTAEDDGGLREVIENPADPNGSAAYLAANVQFRAFSLRREFGPAFQRLLGAPINTAVELDLTADHLGFYLRGRAIAPVRAEVALVVDAAPGGFALVVDNTPAAGFAGDPQAYGGLPAVRVDAAFANGIFGRHTITVTALGGLASAAAPARLDPDLLRDIVLIVGFTA